MTSRGAGLVGMESSDSPVMIKQIWQTFFSHQHINKKTKNTRDDPITMHTSPRQTHTSIGPSNQSEETRPSVTIDRHQTEGDTREKSCKGTLTFTQKPQTPQNKQSDTVTMGTITNWLMMLLGTSNSIYLIQGSFTLPCIPLFILFISVTCQQGLLYRQRYRYKNPLAKKIIPIFFHYITVALGLPLHKHIHRYYFLIRKNPEPFSYRHTSISRCHFMYTKIQSREILSHQKHC